MRRKATNPQIRLLLRELDQAYDKKAWHGTTLRGSLRGLTVKEARWRPARGRHNIWELVLHAAYWKYIVLRKLSGDSELKFPRAGSNFPRLPKKADSKAWAKDVRLLQERHDLLRKTVRDFSASRLHARSAKSIWNNVDHIHGIAAHDLYHAGQIQLLKRLQRRK